MPRLARRLFALCSAASLLLCVAACALWVRSYRQCDTVDSFWPTGHRRQGYAGTRGFAVVSVRGGLHVLYIGKSLNSSGRQSLLGWRAHPASDAAFHELEFPPIGLPGARVYYKRRSQWVAIHHVWLLGVFALLPAASLARATRIRRRAARRQCPACGYDLRASPDRCPEMFSLL